MAIRAPDRANKIPTLRKIREGPVQANLVGASLKTQLKKHTVKVNSTNQINFFQVLAIFPY